MSRAPDSSAGRAFGSVVVTLTVPLILPAAADAVTETIEPIQRKATQHKANGKNHVPSVRRTGGAQSLDLAQ